MSFDSSEGLVVGSVGVSPDRFLGAEDRLILSDLVLRGALRHPGVGLEITKRVGDSSPQRLTDADLLDLATCMIHAGEIFNGIEL